MLKPPVQPQDNASGDANAPVTLVEYGDYQCPHCGHAHPLIQRIREKLSSDLRFVFRNFPLSELHPQAFAAAVATEAAAKQGAFWPMHDIIFEHQQMLGEEDLLKYAAILQLDTTAFANDLENDTLAQKVDADFESGIRSGVNGTPTFFINGNRFNGSLENNGLLKALQTAIANPRP